MDIIGEAARAYVKNSSTRDTFDVNEVAAWATKIASGEIDVGEGSEFRSHLQVAMESCSELTISDVDKAMPLCRAATEWYNSLFDATNVLWEGHGGVFVPTFVPSQGEHPSQQEYGVLDSRKGVTQG